MADFIGVTFLFLVSALAGLGVVGLFGQLPDQIDAAAVLKMCEKDLPRTQHCVLKAEPAARNGKGE